MLYNLTRLLNACCSLNKSYRDALSPSYLLVCSLARFKCVFFIFIFFVCCYPRKLKHDAGTFERGIYSFGLDIEICCVAWIPLYLANVIQTSSFGLQSIDGFDHEGFVGDSSISFIHGTRHGHGRSISKFFEIMLLQNSQRKMWSGLI